MNRCGLLHSTQRVTTNWCHCYSITARIHTTETKRDWPLSIWRSGDQTIRCCRSLNRRKLCWSSGPRQPEKRGQECLRIAGIWKRNETNNSAFRRVSSGKANRSLTIYKRRALCAKSARGSSAVALKSAAALLHAARPRLTTGKCLRPLRNVTLSSGLAPGLPRTKAHGRAHGEPRGQRVRGS
jgi:hypothetical protein